MSASIRESPLYPIVNPKSIAIFGASNRFTSMGTNQLSSLNSSGYQGKIYPVHRSEKQVLGINAYQSVLDLPEVPDLAVIVLPTLIVPQVVEDCGKKGIRHAIVVSGGFKEVGGEGVELEKKLKTVAEHFNIRFLGPNCLGVANPHHKFNVTFMPFEGHPGFIGLASQSGSLITQMFSFLRRRGLGFSTGISVGNEANIDIVDCLEYLDTCPHTKVIALYIESIKRGRVFIERARSIMPRKPIVAFYASGSEGGRRASFSHTGALAGPDALYEGVFRQSGIIRAGSLTELFDICWVLGMCPRPQSNRVIIQTHSGGPGAAAADACSRTGLKLPGLSKKTLENLRPLVPHTGSVANPVDLTFAKDPLDFFKGIPDTLLAESGADGLLMYFLTPTKIVERGMKGMGIEQEKIPGMIEKLFEHQANSLKALQAKHQKPIIGFTFQSLEDQFIRKLLTHGIPVLSAPERAVRAMAALVHYTRLRNKIAP